MLVRLSGERYVATEHIEHIDPSAYENQDVRWAVWFTSGNYIGLTQKQFDELIAVMPKPANGAFQLALQRRAEQVSLADAELWKEERR